MVSGYGVCFLFQGFAEIIDLLDKNGKKQDAIIELLKNCQNDNVKTTKTELEDIESNLPKL